MPIIEGRPVIEGRRCSSHEDLIKEVSRISANTHQIMLTVNRIEERSYQEHGKTEKTAGMISGSIKAITVAAAIGAAVATAINIVV